MGAWRRVKKETIGNCSSKCGFNEATLELFIDDDADAEFLKLQNYISEISPDSMVECYLNQDKDAVTYISQHGGDTFNELEGGHEGKNSSFCN